MSAGVKQVSAGYPVGEIVFFRSAFAIVPLLAWLGWRRELAAAVKTSNVGGHVLRGLIGGCGRVRRRPDHAAAPSRFTGAGARSFGRDDGRRALLPAGRVLRGGRDRADAPPHGKA